MFPNDLYFQIVLRSIDILSYNTHIWQILQYLRILFTYLERKKDIIVKIVHKF